MKTVRFYIKVVKNRKNRTAKMIFRTQEYTMPARDLPKYIKEFRSTIRKDCDIILHPVKVSFGRHIGKEDLKQIIIAATE